ncbi:hypothetical protein GF1_32270 [Desulfolithobacter dissulfuricans]|uniref:PilZ domain-containing protein n=1 Tax=Desulfolithobacter dissulfuricans TaxID=2795293 RepID=A0A915UBB4_9BACT|nr:PilZ domain-containing protein [Desulfolithobacter dissulfuricans]BCO10851.1 hypothetical protein GF1_32270 [Desulfolithobacter dissulfuricans]
MSAQDRRSSYRYQLYYPINMRVARSSSEDDWHLAEILDAGRNGVRLLVTGGESLPVGSELEFASLPSPREENGRGRRSEFRCRVVWEDSENHLVGLTYIQ